MKTIQELNSKWYWRLIKVLYSFILVLITIGGSIGFIAEYMTYDPKNIDLVQTEVDNFKNMYIEISEFDSKIKKEFPGKFISKSELLNKSDIVFSGVTLKVKRLGTIKGLGYNIEGVIIGKNDDPERVFDDWMKINGFELYVEDVSYFREVLEKGQAFIQESQDGINDAKDGKYVYISKNYFSNDYDKKLGNKDYIGIMLIIKTIGIAILIILGLMILTIIIRGISYYIVLGKFNPEK